MRLRRTQRGFSYLLLLVLTAVISFTAANAVTLGHQVQRRQAEQALLVVGAEFEAALASYRRIGTAVGRAAPTGPQELTDLLRDPRFPGVRRHLRRLPADPLTGKQQWGLERDLNRAIVGVYSLAEGTPIKRSGFGPLQSGFEEAESYAAWVFGNPAPRRRLTGAELK